MSDSTGPHADFFSEWSALSDRYANALERWHRGDLEGRAEALQLEAALRRMAVNAGGDRRTVPLTIFPAPFRDPER